MTLAPLDQIWIIAAGAGALMIILWFVQLRTRDAGIVDVGWSYGLAAAAAFSAITGSGAPTTRFVIAILVGVWGLRLGTHILTDRVLSDQEDGRYTMLRELTGSKFQPVLLGFYLFQALLVPVLSIPFTIACATPDSGVTWFLIVGVALWLVSKTGEFIADQQLKRFKKRPDSSGKTCREGLWRYSRHPNYFFEWLMWVAYALIALGGPQWWWAWIAPALMLVLILKVTGIPPTEARAVKSRGEDYREYQRTTSAFVPWPPKTAPLAGDGGADA